MPSSTAVSEIYLDSRRNLGWSGLRLVPTVADVPDSDVAADREEYLYRLGNVLALARGAARKPDGSEGYTQDQAAAELKMSGDSIGRWEAGLHKISAYDLARLVRLYDFDPDLAINPPASQVEIRRRLGIVSAAARRALRRGQLHPLDEDEGAPE